MEKYHFIDAVTRLFRGFKRPMHTTNERLELQLHHDEVFQSLTFRQALPGDIPELARLEVTAWNDTYPELRHKPTLELRERQWQEAFRTADDTWLCYVVETYLENQPGELIGFVQGNLYTGDLAGFEGQLNNICVLEPYQHQGIGTKLIGYLARGFLSHSIFSMVLFAEPDDPSRRFYEVLGAEKLDAGNNMGYEAYGWRDLETLAAGCPID